MPAGIAVAGIVAALWGAQPAAPPPAPSAAPAQLTGAMSDYAWFPGRWACRTALASAANREPVPGKLWVVVDPGRNAVDEYFATTAADGSPYRSDDVLRYDAARHDFVRSAVDARGTRIVLAAAGPYRPTMRYAGFLTLHKTIYRLRATLTYDASAQALTTLTAFYDAKTKTWPVQTTTVCTKIAP